MDTIPGARVSRLPRHLRGGGMIGAPPQPNAFERRGLAEGERAQRELHPVEAQVETRSDPAAGLRFLEEAIGASTLVAIHPETRQVRGLWFDPAETDRATAWIEARTADGFNLYFAMNLAPGCASKPAKADVTVLRAAAFADVDAKDGRTLAAALAALDLLPPASFTIATGGGFQPVWLLETATPATPEAVAASEALSKRIAALAGGDAVGNVDRILRLPFTMNFPNAGKRAAGRVPTPSGLVRGRVVG